MSDRPGAKDRSSIRREYKESYRPAGVFQIRNTTNDRILVRSSANLPAMFNRLRMQLDTGSYLMHPELQRDWQALGGASFAFEVLEELTPPEGPGWDPTDDLEALEALWLEQLSPYDEKGYNRRPRS